MLIARRLPLALVLAAAPVAAQEMEGYRDKEVMAVACQLADQMGMPLDKRDNVESRLETVLASERFQVKYGGLPIRGVFVYQVGEGGFIVKVKRGHGLLQWYGDGGVRSMNLKSTTFGAQIGGSSEWGIGLVVGPSERGFFGGDYGGGTLSAAIGNAGTSVTELSRRHAFGPAAGQRVYLIGSASGATANAAAGKLTITVEQ